LREKRGASKRIQFFTKPLHIAIGCPLHGTKCIVL
jgi:hypothetical protein